jgi:hypothetical protein
MDEDAAKRFITAHAGARLPLLVESFARVTGRPLLDGGAASADAIWAAPRVILAHGLGADPLMIYGNRMGLELFEIDPPALVRMPSRLTAEAPERDERARLLSAVSRDGFIDDYAGVRVSATGRRFRIEQATVWNLVDAVGVIHGQAATFAGWTRLD